MITATVFPQNLTGAAVRFLFSRLYLANAETIRGRLDFEGGVYRYRHARAYAAVVCTYNAHAHTY